MFATALTLNGQNIEYRPLKIGYLSSPSTNETIKVTESEPAGSYLDRLLQNVNSYIGFSRKRRSLNDEEEDDIENIIDDVHYIAMEYVKLFSLIMKNENYDIEESWMNLNDLYDSLSNYGQVQNKVNNVLYNKLSSLMK